MKNLLSNKAAFVSIIVIVIGLIAFLAFYIYTKQIESSRSIVVDEEIQLNVVDNSRRFSYELNENELDRFVNISGVTSNSLMTRFGQRIKEVNVVIDEQIYSESQTVDPQSGVVYVSSQVSQTSNVLLINIGLGDIPQSVVDVEAYVNKLINIAIFNGLHFNESEEYVNQKVSTLKRSGLDITAPLDRYDVIIFGEVNIK